MNTQTLAESSADLAPPIGLLDAALALLAEGRSIFPVLVARRNTGGWSKTPLVKRPMEQRYTEGELRALWPAEANAIGMECGRISGVIRLDAEGPVPWSDFGTQPNAGHFKSVSGADGWLMLHVDGIKSMTLWKGTGHAELKVQSDGQFTVVPPSAGYAQVNEGLGRVPGWLMELAAAQMLAELEKGRSPIAREPGKEDILAALEHIPPEEYDRWVQVGMALKASGYDLSVWEEWSKKGSTYQEGVCARKWDTFNKAGRTVTARSIPYWAEEYGYKQPNRHEPISPVGNAKMLARLGQGRIVHSSELGWMAYCGGVWKTRGDAEKLVLSIQQEVLRARKEAAVKSLAKHLATDANAPGFKDTSKRKLRTIQLIEHHEDTNKILSARMHATTLLSANAKEFDQQPLLLNCKNGILDLAKREFRDHDPEDKLTQQCPATYDPQAVCPRWDRFLLEVFDSNQELIDYMQRFLGYCLTGSTEHHVLPIWYGTGRNGKGTIVRVLESILGSDYVVTLSSGYLAETWNKPHDTKFMTLKGKRIAVEMETNDSMRLNEEMVKRLTGGDSITARYMRMDEESFRPTHKLILATNYEPNVRNQDTAIWTRIQKVPFNQSFAGKEEHNLDETLAKEASGILNWMVQGCYAWQDATGLNPPCDVKAATASYQEEQNTVKRFVDEMTKPGSAEQKTRKSAVTDRYKVWCKDRGVQAVGGKVFGTTVKRLGVGDDHSYYHLVLCGS